MTNGNESINVTYWDERNQPAFKIDDGGLTKREHFAAMAMQGIIARGEPVSIKDGLFANEASICVACADALITALNKPL